MDHAAKLAWDWDPSIELSPVIASQFGRTQSDRMNAILVIKMRSLIHIVGAQRRCSDKRRAWDLFSGVRPVTEHENNELTPKAGIKRLLSFDAARIETLAAEALRTGNYAAAALYYLEIRAFIRNRRTDLSPHELALIQYFESISRYLVGIINC